MKTKKSNYAEEAGKLTAPKSRKKDSVPKIRKCKYSNCPINADTAINGQYTCSFHDTAHYHDDVTVAIIKNKSFRLNYNTMVKWKVKDWVKNKDRLINHKHLPMNEEEPPSLYLIRFFKFLSDKIKRESSEAVTKRINNYPGGFEEEF